MRSADAAASRGENPRRRQCLASDPAERESEATTSDGSAISFETTVGRDAGRRVAARLGEASHRKRRGSAPAIPDAGDVRKICAHSVESAELAESEGETSNSQGSRHFFETADAFAVGRRFDFPLRGKFVAEGASAKVTFVTIRMRALSS